MKLTVNRYKVILILIFLLYVILRLPSLFEPHRYDDEAVYSAVASQMRYGETLYKDVWDNKPPMIYLIYLLGNILGNTLLFVRFANLLFGFCTLFLILKISTHFFTRKKSLVITFLGAVLLNNLIIEFNLANAENFYILFTTFGIYLLICKKRYFLAGLSFGIGLLLKIHPIVEVFAICSALLFLKSFRKLQFKKAFVLGIASLIPLFFTLAIFAIFGNLKSLWSAVFTSMFTYASSGYGGFEKILFVPNTLFLRLFIFLFLLLLLIVFLQRNNGQKHEDKSVIYAWFLSACFGTVISTRSYGHYLIEVIPSFLIMLGLFFQDHNIFSKKNIFRVIISCLIAGAFLIFFAQSRLEEIKHPKPYVNSIEYYKNFSYYAFGSKSKEDYRNFFWFELNSMYYVASYIKENTNESDYVYFADETAWFYELADVKNPTRYVVYYHLWFGDEVRVDEVVHDLDVKEPKYIVIPKDRELVSEIKKLLEEKYEYDLDFIDAKYSVYKLSNY